MKALRHGRALTDTDVRRQDAIEHQNPFLFRNRNARIEVADLPFRMNARVGSTGSYDLAILARDPANSFFQCALNGSLSRLRGPAAEIGSVVRDDEFESFSRQAPARLGALRRPSGRPLS